MTSIASVLCLRAGLAPWCPSELFPFFFHCFLRVVFGLPTLRVPSGVHVRAVAQWLLWSSLSHRCKKRSRKNKKRKKRDKNKKNVYKRWLKNIDVFQPTFRHFVWLGILTFTGVFSILQMGGAWHKWPNGKYASDWHYAT